MRASSILKRYFFFHPEKSPMDSLMCFGIMCDKGWLPLIDEMCHKIDTLIKEKYMVKCGPDAEYPFEFTEIKEKYAGLRAYSSGAPDEIWEIIDEYEKRSYHVCELCGKEGGIHAKVDWLKTLCGKCGKKEKYTPLCSKCYDSNVDELGDVCKECKEERVDADGGYL